MPLQQAAHDVQSLQPAASHQFGTEILPQESQMSPVVASLTAQQKSHIQQPVIAAQTTQKVKRQDDIWTGEFERFFFSKFQPKTKTKFDLFMKLQVT